MKHSNSLIILGLTGILLAACSDGGNEGPQSGDNTQTDAGTGEESAYRLFFGDPPPAKVDVDTTWPTFSVELRDENDAVLEMAGVAVSLELVGGTTFILGGTVRSSDSSGIALFEGLSYGAVETVTFNVLADGFEPIMGIEVDVQGEVVEPPPEEGEPDHLSIQTDTSNMAYGAGEIWEPLSVVIHDAAHNVVEDTMAAMTISLVDGGGVLSGTLERAVIRGEAVFDDLSYNIPEVITVEINQPELGTWGGIEVTITAGEPAMLVFETPPTSPVMSGEEWPEFTLQVADQAGNVLTDVDVDVEIDNIDGLGTLEGDLTQDTDSDGLITFDELSYDTAETVTFDIVPEDETITGILEVEVVVEQGASHLAFDVPPGVIEVDDEDWDAFTVRVEMPDGSLADDGATLVTVELLEGDGELEGVLTESSEDGVATFDDLKFEGTGPIVFDVISEGLTGLYDNRLLVVDDYEVEEFLMPLTLSDGLARLNGDSSAVSITPDGRYIVFVSDADNLTGELLHGEANVWLYDRLSDDFTLISRGVDGQPTSGSAPQISGDGQYIVYVSSSDMLVEGDGNGVADVFMFDRSTGLTERLSVSTAGTEGNGDSSHPGISDDGLLVVFQSDADNLSESVDSNGTGDVFLRDLQFGVTRLYSVSDDGSSGNGNSGGPVISGDGISIAYYSTASNLVAGDTNANQDCFEVAVSGAGGLPTGTVRVNLGDDGQQSIGHCEHLSYGFDRSVLSFTSTAGDLVSGDFNLNADVFVRNEGGVISRISVSPGGLEISSFSMNVGLSSNSQYALFSADDGLVEGDDNGLLDLFMYDIEEDTLTRLSLGEAGEQPDNDITQGDIADDGRTVVYTATSDALMTSDSNGYSDIYFLDLDDGELAHMIGQYSNTADSDSFSPSLSANGRYAAWVSLAANLVENDLNGSGDVFWYDADEEDLLAITLEGGGGATSAEVSGDGLFVVFTSDLPYSEDDGNSDLDVYLYDVDDESFELVSYEDSGDAVGDSEALDVTPGGGHVLFRSSDDDLVDADLTGAWDIYLRDLTTGTVTLVSQDGDGDGGNEDSTGGAVSADGSRVLFTSNADNFREDDEGETPDCFLSDTGTGLLTHIASGTCGGLSLDGEVATVTSGDEAWVYYVATGELVQVGDSATDGASSSPTVSADGEFVLYQTLSSALYVYEVTSGDSELVITGASDEWFDAQISADGASLIFQSVAIDLVEADLNGASDIFVIENPL